MSTAKLLITLAGGVCGALFGELDGFLTALIVCVCIDYLTGVLAAIYNKMLSSEIGAKGICKKVCIFCLVALAHIIDCCISKDGSVIRTATIFFYLTNEGVSIIENAAKMNIPVPDKLVDTLEQLKENKTSKNAACVEEDEYGERDNL